MYLILIKMLSMNLKSIILMKKCLNINIIMILKNLNFYLLLRIHYVGIERIK